MSEFYEIHLSKRSYFAYETYANEFGERITGVLEEFSAIKSTDPNYAGELWAKVTELYLSG